MSLERPDDTYAEDLHRFVWADGVEMVLERFIERKEDVSCELAVSSSHPTKGGTLYRGRLLLMGPSSRRDVRTALERRDEEPDWGGMLEQACALSLKRYRAGEPVVDLFTIDTSQPSRYLIRPFVFDRALNVIYGDGASAKSVLALAMGLAVASGEAIGSIEAEDTGRALYLDWEDDPETHAERLQALCKGAGVVLEADQVLYQRMTASLAEASRDIRKLIVERGVRLVIVDSVGMACGGDPNDAATLMRCMVAARSLAVPVVAIHHIGKDAKDKSKPYGSVYASNETRSSWLVEKQQDEGSDELRVALTNQKTNRSRVAPRQAFVVRFHNAGDRLEQIDLRSLSFGQSSDVGTVSQKWTLATVLREYGSTTVKALAETTGISPSRVRTVLTKHPDFFTEVGEAGRGVEGRWALKAPDRGEDAPLGNNVASDALQPRSSGSDPDLSGAFRAPLSEEESPF